MFDLLKKKNSTVNCGGSRLFSMHLVFILFFIFYFFEKSNGFKIMTLNIANFNDHANWQIRIQMIVDVIIKNQPGFF